MKKPTGTKSIFLSKRAFVFYLERCKVIQVDERVVYLNSEGASPAPYFNIPEKNTAFLLLGRGTSITDSAIRRLAAARVVVGFCGTGATPLHSIVDFVFLSPVSEYGPTEHHQQWFALWTNPEKRLSAAKSILSERSRVIIKLWKLHYDNAHLIQELSEKFRVDIEATTTNQSLLLVEARWAKTLYRIQAELYGLQGFSREYQSDIEKSVCARINRFLDHGNYLAYGYAAVALTGLGISYALAVLHGKTRRGGLVFDIADTFKDALILPLAFEAGISGWDEKRFRAEVIERCHKFGVLDHLFAFIKVTIENSLKIQ